MDEKTKVEVTINGQSHAFMSKESEVDYICFLAKYLDDKISEVSGTNFGNLLANDRKYILTAMNILDDYFKLLDKYDEINKKQESFSEKDVYVAKDLANQVSNLQKENAGLNDRLENTEYELSYVQQLYKELKDEYDKMKNSPAKSHGKR